MPEVVVRYVNITVLVPIMRDVIAKHPYGVALYKNALGLLPPHQPRYRL